MNSTLSQKPVIASRRALSGPAILISISVLRMGLLSVDRALAVIRLRAARLSSEHARDPVGEHAPVMRRRLGVFGGLVVENAKRVHDVVERDGAALRRLPQRRRGFDRAGIRG